MNCMNSQARVRYYTVLFRTARFFDVTRHVFSLTIVFFYVQMIYLNCDASDYVYFYDKSIRERYDRSWDVLS